jgi:hypothetical protein
MSITVNVENIEFLREPIDRALAKAKAEGLAEGSVLALPREFGPMPVGLQRLRPPVSRGRGRSALPEEISGSPIDRSPSGSTTLRPPLKHPETYGLIGSITLPAAKSRRPQRILSSLDFIYCPNPLMKDWRRGCGGRLQFRHVPVGPRPWKN